MGYEAGKNRLECVGDVEESADLIDYYCNQIEQHHGFETTLGTLGPERRELERAAPVRRVGGDLALQLSTRPRGGSGGRRARRWQHGRLQTRVGDAAARLQAARSDGRGGNPRGRVQFRHRRRRHCRAGTRRQPARRRHRLHRIERRRHAPDSRQRDAKGPAAAHHRDGRQESRRSSPRPRISTRRATA